MTEIIRIKFYIIEHRMKASVASSSGPGKVLTSRQVDFQMVEVAVPGEKIWVHLNRIGNLRLEAM